MSKRCIVNKNVLFWQAYLEKPFDISMMPFYLRCSTSFPSFCSRLLNICYIDQRAI